MLIRLIELRASVNEVLDEMSWDQILASEWKLLEQVATLLKPFADHTRLLEGDQVALSSVIPAAIDLECHLLGFQQDQTKDDALKVLA